MVTERVEEGTADLALLFRILAHADPLDLKDRSAVLYCELAMLARNFSDEIRRTARELDFDRASTWATHLG